MGGKQGTLACCTLVVAAFAITGCSAEPSGMPDADASAMDSGADTGDSGLSDSGPRPDRPPFVQPDVLVRISGDNAYGFGYGSSTGIATYFNGREARLACDIFCCSATCDAVTPCATGTCDFAGTCNDDGRGPETYVVPGSETTATDYLYIIAWSDDLVTQGVLGQFVARGRTQVVYTGSDRWEVCATGMDFDIGMGGPDTTTIGQQIVACNGGGGVSNGWQGTTGAISGMAVGETNDPGSAGEFPGACADPTRGDGIDQAARWMWYDEDLTDGVSAFRSMGSGGAGEFLIFRLVIQELLI